jgi:large subunit ribosomal protein L24
MSAAAKMKVRAGDTVVVLTGKDKGRRGEVIRALPRQGKVIVAGVNRVKRHLPVRPDTGTRGGTIGGITEREAAIDVSNVALIDPSTDKPCRVGYRITQGGQKVRVARPSGTDLDPVKDR